MMKSRILLATILIAVLCFNLLAGCGGTAIPTPTSDIELSTVPSSSGDPSPSTGASAASGTPVPNNGESFGQTAARQNLPEKTTKVNGKVLSVSCGYSMVAAITSDGALWTWGHDGDYGALGSIRPMGPQALTSNYDENTPYDFIPVRVGDLAAQESTSVSVGKTYEETVALVNTDGSVTAWGYSGDGRLFSYRETEEYSPNKRLEGKWAKAVSSSNFLSILDINGGLWIGEDGGFIRDSLDSGQLRDLPNFVKVLDGVREISNGGDLVGVILEDDSLWTWKNGGIFEKVTDNVVSVSCFGSNGLALMKDGTVCQWGFSDFDGYSIEIYDSVEGLNDVVAISCGDAHCAAIRSDGTLWMWGNNEYGQLGDPDEWGRYSYKDTPFKVLEDVEIVSCGQDFTGAITSDGSLWMWGNNSHGQIGNGTWDHVPAPIKVLIPE